MFLSAFLFCDAFGSFLCMSKFQVVQLQCISVPLHAALKKSSHLRVII